MWLRERKGQSTVEYAVVIAVIIAALIAMQIYMKRGTMGKLRDATDQIGDQFSPYQTQSKFTRTYNSTRNEMLFTNGMAETKFTGTPERQGREGYENVMRLNAETLMSE